MFVCFYGLLALIAASLTVSVWRRGQLPSKHIPCSLIYDVEVIHTRLVMLLILAGFVFIFLMSTGMFDKPKHHTIVTVPYHEPGQTRYYQVR